MYIYIKFSDPSITSVESLVSFSGLSGTNPVVKFLFQQVSCRA
jgi:hypothetical protein